MSKVRAIYRKLVNAIQYQFTLFSSHKYNKCLGNIREMDAKTKYQKKIIKMYISLWRKKSKYTIIIVL